VICSRESGEMDERLCGSYFARGKKLVIPFQGHDTGIRPAVARLTTLDNAPYTRQSLERPIQGLVSQEYTHPSTRLHHSGP
jgi:hypothetical protein